MSDRHKPNGRVLVVFYSLTGNTARVARDIAKRIGADVESIHDHSHATGSLGFLKAALDALMRKSTRIGDVTHNPADYALTIVGTPVWVGTITPAVRSYLWQMRGKLHDVAFFVTSGDADATKVVPSLEALAQREAVVSTGFNLRELQDPAAYEAKIGAFVSALESIEAARADSAARTTT